MVQVFIIVESSAGETAQSITALKNAISVKHRSELQARDVEVVLASDLVAEAGSVNDRILCPLTLDLPETLSFPAQAIFSACRDVAGLRSQLEAWQYSTGDGDFWLPIVLTAKGALYGEVIGTKTRTASENTSPALHYTQPVHLSDQQRQPLYALGQRLLRSLHALPAVYLMQFSWQDGAVCFDRLLPFPAAPAIASLTVQAPDLFACHWACLTGNPLLDLTID